MKKTKITSVLIILLFTLTGCKNLFNSQKTDGTESDSGMLHTINVTCIPSLQNTGVLLNQSAFDDDSNDSSRAAFPKLETSDSSKDNYISSYVLEAVNTKGKIINSSGSYICLPNGTWYLRAYGYHGSGSDKKLILKTPIDERIILELTDESQLTSNISVKVRPYQTTGGTGTVSLAVAYKNDVTNIQSAYYSIDGGEEKQLTFSSVTPYNLSTIKIDSTSTPSAISSGSHTLNIYFYNKTYEGTATPDYQDIVYSCNEFFNVYDNLCTNNWVKSGQSEYLSDISAGSGNLAICVTKELLVKNPNLYVGENGNNTTGDGSWATPYKSLKTAVDKVNAINDGTTHYTINLLSDVVVTEIIDIQTALDTDYNLTIQSEALHTDNNGNMVPYFVDFENATGGLETGIRINTTNWNSSTCNVEFKNIGIKKLKNNQGVISAYDGSQYDLDDGDSLYSLSGLVIMEENFKDDGSTKQNLLASQKIKITNTLLPGSRIGVTAGTSVTPETPVQITTGFGATNPKTSLDEKDLSPADIFFSDNDEGIAAWNSNSSEVVLVQSGGDAIGLNARNLLISFPEEVPDDNEITIDFYLDGAKLPDTELSDSGSVVLEVKTETGEVFSSEGTHQYSFEKTTSTDNKRQCLFKFLDGNSYEGKLTLCVEVIYNGMVYTGSKDYVFIESTKPSFCKWAESATGVPLSGSTYSITTKEDLITLQKMVNGTWKEGVSANRLAGVTFEVICDINLGGMPWEPIGTYSDEKQYEFSSTFKGNGHTISGLNIVNTEGVEPSTEYIGFFGYLTGTVENLKIRGTSLGGGIAGYVKRIEYTDVAIENCVSYLSFNIGNSFASYIYLGGIVSLIYCGTIKNCTFEGRCNINCSKPIYFGGISGYTGVTSQSCIVDSCVNNGNITAIGSGGHNIAGIAAYNFSEIKECKNYGNLNGNSGVAGICCPGTIFATDSVENCENYGDISGSGDVGGICSYAFGDIKNCKNYGAVTAQQTAGGIVASFHASEKTISGCENYGTITGTYTGTNCSTGGIVGYITLNINKVLNCSNYGDIKGNGDGGNGFNNTSAENCSIGTGGIIGYTYQDNTNTNDDISNCYENCNNYACVDGTWYVGGIIGYANFKGSAGTEKKLINNCSNKGNVTATKSYAGGIVGGIASTKSTGDTGLYASFNSDDYPVMNCRNSGYIKGSHSVGGIFGNSCIYMTDNLTNAKQIMTMINCLNTGTIEGTDGGLALYLGGINGCGDDTVLKNCVSTGSIIVSSISDIPDPTPTLYVGGLQNRNQSKVDANNSQWQLFNCYYRQNCVYFPNLENNTSLIPTAIGTGSPELFLPDGQIESGANVTGRTADVTTINYYQTAVGSRYGVSPKKDGLTDVAAILNHYIRAVDGLNSDYNTYNQWGYNADGELDFAEYVDAPILEITNVVTKADDLESALSKADTIVSVKVTGDTIGKLNEILSKEEAINAQIELDMTDWFDSYSHNTAIEISYNTLPISENNKSKIVSIILPKQKKPNISNNYFQSFTNLKTVEINADFFETADQSSWVFQNCTSIEKVIIHEGVTKVSTGTFSGCKNLKEVILPSTLEIIGNNAFADCGFDTIVIPKNVETIEFYVFLSSGYVYEDWNDSYNFSDENTSWNRDVLKKVIFEDKNSTWKITRYNSIPSSFYDSYDTSAHPTLTRLPPKPSIEDFNPADGFDSINVSDPEKNARLFLSVLNCFGYMKWTKN